MEKKTTKREYFAQVIEVLKAQGCDELVTFCEHEVELLTKKAESKKSKGASAENIALAEAVRAARERGEEAGIAFAGGYKRTMMIRSPSKVMKDLGEHTGEGLNIGLRDSLKRAVATARLISGQIATAADISKDVRVSVPGLQQEIVGANQQTATPVYLNGVQIAEIQGHNNSMQLAWQNTKAAKGVGSR